MIADIWQSQRREVETSRVLPLEMCMTVVGLRTPSASLTLGCSGHEFLIPSSDHREKPKDFVKIQSYHQIFCSH